MLDEPQPGQLRPARDIFQNKPLPASPRPVAIQKYIYNDIYVSQSEQTRHTDILNLLS